MHVPVLWVHGVIKFLLASDIVGRAQCGLRSFRFYSKQARMAQHAGLAFSCNLGFGWMAGQFIHLNPVPHMMS